MKLDGLRVQLPGRAPEASRKRAWRRWALPAAFGGAAISWYAADSLRHRREGAFGYDLAESVPVDSPEFLRTAEALTGAPISHGNEAELLINGDQIFPAFLETISAAQRTLNVQTYIYWRGGIAREVAGAIVPGRRTASSARSSSTPSAQRRWIAR